MKKISALLVLIILLNTLPIVSFASEGYYGSINNPLIIGENTITVFEAENMPVGGNKNYKIVKDPDASGGMGVSLDQYITANGSVGYAYLSIEDIEYRLYTLLPKGVTQFSVWLRFKSFRPSDSIAYSFNDMSSTYLALGETLGTLNQYNWTSLMINANDLKSINLVFRSEVIIDKIVISTDLLYFPSGFGDTYTPFSIGVDTTDYSNLIYPLPPYTPKSDRPRVMFNKQMLETARENLKYEENKIMYDELVKTANGDVEKFTKPSEYMYYSDSNAFLYIFNGDKVAGRKAVDTIIKGLKQYTEDSKNSRTAISARREMGDYIHYAARVYDWCYDLMTEDEKFEIIKSVLYFSSSQEMGFPPTSQSGFTNAHDSENQIFRDMLAFAIASYEDYPEYYNLVAGKFFYEMINMRNWLYEDSSLPATGSEYGFSRMLYEAYLGCLLRAAGLDGILDSQHKFGYSAIYDLRPHGYTARIGDCWARPTTRNSAGTTPSLFYIGNYYRDPYIRQMYFSDTSVSYPAYSDMVVFNDPSIGLGDLSELPTSYFAGKKSGVMYAKTGWSQGRTSKDMSVTMQLPERLFGGHGHYDSGNFTIYYKGNLVVDSGLYEGLAFTDENGKYITNIASNSDHDLNYHKRTVAHNCMLVHDPDEDPKIAPDGGQKSFAPFSVSVEYLDENSKAGTILGYEWGEDMNHPSYTYMKGDIKDAYSDKVTGYTRSFMFLDFFDEIYPGALIVYDKISSKDATFEKDWLLHFNSDYKPVIEGNRTQIEKTNDGDNGRLINETLLPKEDNLKIETIGGKNMEFYSHGKNWTAVTYKKNADHGNWRIEVTPKNSSKTDYFLNVLQVGDATLKPEPLKSELIETKTHYGVKIKDRVVLFSKEDGRIKEDIEFTINGNEEKYLYMVADVKEGLWTLYKNGVRVKDVEVTDEGGMAYFEGSSGTYTLKRNIRVLASFSKNYDIFDNLNIKNDDHFYLRLNDTTIGVDGKMIKENGKIYLPMFDHINNLGGYYELKGDTVTVFANEKSFKDINIDGTNAKYVDDKLYVDIECLKDVLEYTIEDVLLLGNTINFKGGIIKAYIYDYDTPGIAKIKNVSGKDYEIDSSPTYAVDGEDATLWKTNKVGSYLEVEFEKNYNLKGLEVSWAIDRQHWVEISVSKDGENFETILDEWLDVRKVSNTDSFSTYEIKAEDIKYIRFGVKQNSTNGLWGNIKDIKFLVEE